MIGAIAGDIIGSVHEGAGTKTKAFKLFKRCGAQRDLPGRGRGHDGMYRRRYRRSMCF